jgi:transcriptional regulator with XRE-family HTH domain
VTIQELVGYRIGVARRKIGATQTELGERLEEYLGRPWSRQAVSAAEAGGRDFTAAELLALARILDVPIAWFFLPTGDDDEYEFPSGNSVPFGELADSVLLGGPTGNAAQALVEEAMDIVNALDRLRRDLDQRARGVVRASARLAGKAGITTTGQVRKGSGEHAPGRRHL